MFFFLVFFSLFIYLFLFLWRFSSFHPFWSFLTQRQCSDQQCRRRASDDDWSSPGPDDKKSEKWWSLGRRDPGEDAMLLLPPPPPPPPRELRGEKEGVFECKVSREQRSWRLDCASRRHRRTTPRTRGRGGKGASSFERRGRRRGRGGEERA